MRRRAALLATAAVWALLALAAGCSSRDHSNPLDPFNPQTHGRPTGFEALASNGQVLLVWDANAAPGLLGYQLERRSAGDTAWTVFDLFPPKTGSFTDFGLANGTRVDYRIAYEFGDHLSPYANDYATPGPLRAWVTDVGAAALLRLTADGRHVLGVDPGFTEPVGVAVDPVQGTVWTSDDVLGILVSYNPANGNRLEIGHLQRPGLVAVDPGLHTAWVCEEGAQRVHQFHDNGSEAFPNVVGPVSFPLAVAVDAETHAVWVCDYDARVLRQFGSDGTLHVAQPVPQPSRVAVDSLTHDAWVTSFDNDVAVRVSPEGVPQDTVRGLAGPIGVAVDARRGTVWICEAQGNTLTELGRDGTVLRRIPGLARVRDVAIDLDSGRAWATVPGSGSVVVVDPAGTVIASVDGLREPYDIAVDPGQSFLRSARGAATQRDDYGMRTITRDDTRVPSRKRSQ